MNSIDATVEVTKFDKSLPIVLLNEIPLVYGSDYSWYDCTHEIIRFEFNLKPMDRVCIVYRDDDYLPTERIYIVINKYIMSDTKFNIRTLEIVKWEDI